MSDVHPPTPEIGRCIGCEQRAVVRDRVCEDCLSSPRRGRKWAEMSHRCRTEPAFAMAVYARIATDDGRELFRRMYGVPTVDAPVSLIVEQVHLPDRPTPFQPANDYEQAIPPPPMPIVDVPVGAPPRMTPHPIQDRVATLLARARNAHAMLQHRAFVEALRGLLPRSAELHTDAVAALIDDAYGIEAVQLAATIAGRWAHARDPSTAERARIGAVLRQRVLKIRIDATGVACALAVDPHEDLWAALARRRPRAALFDIVRYEIGRRRARFITTLREAVAVGRAPQRWLAEVTTMSAEACACGDCVGRGSAAR